MKKIKKLKKNHVLYFSIMVILCEKLLSRMPIGVLDYFKLSDRSINSGYIMLELVILVVNIFMLWLTSQMHILKCSMKNFAKSLWSGMVFFVLAIPGCLLYVSQGATQAVAYKPLLEIVAFIIFVIIVGLAEEILFRGIIADSIFECFGNSSRGVVISVLLGGIFFGLAHITNVLAGQSMEETIIQVIATSMLGILLTAIYIRHKNIYGVAILHAVLDFLTMFKQGFFEGNSLQYQYVDVNFWESLKQSLISQSIFIIVAFFIMRPVVIKKVVASRCE